LECVCGRRYWGKQKYHELISKATEKGGHGKVVTESDEAFALLLFDNYIDKWTNPIALTRMMLLVLMTNEEEESNRDRGGDTQQKRAGTANMEGGVATERHGSINSTSLYRRTGNASKQRQWKWN
jgi:hypothetical protein